MKTSEILKITDEALIVEKLWKEKNSAIRERVEQQRKALEQQLKELQKPIAWDIFAAENADKLKLVDKAFEKAMAFFKTVDDDKVKKCINQFERGIITACELMHDLQRLTIEEAYVGHGQRLAETNW